MRSSGQGSPFFPDPTARVLDPQTVLDGRRSTPACACACAKCRKSARKGRKGKNYSLGSTYGFDARKHLNDEPQEFGGCFCHQSLLHPRSKVIPENQWPAQGMSHTGVSAGVSRVHNSQAKHLTLAQGCCPMTWRCSRTRGQDQQTQNAWSPGILGWCGTQSVT